MRVDRRIARSLVLALLLVAFIGPWAGGSHGHPRLVYFPEIVEHKLRKPDWLSILVAGILMVPVACLSAILAPSSRLAVVAYRVIGGGTAIHFLVRWPRRTLAELIEVWGLGLYLTALLLAVAVEVVPARAAPKRDYTDVFR
jgi:hypothetical protein